MSQESASANKPRSFKPPDTPLWWVNPLAYTLALFVFILAPVLALSWVARPFPGFVVEQTLVISDYNGPFWTARNQGMQYGEKVIQVGSKSVKTPAEFEAAMQSQRTGDHVTIQTISGDGRLHYYPSVQFITFPGFDFFRLFWLPYAIGLAYLALGFWVFIVRWRTRTGRAFAFFSVCTALVNGLLFDLITTHVGTAIWSVAIAQLGGALVSLGLLFPEEWEPVKRIKYIHYLPYAISTGLAGWGLLVYRDYQHPWGYIEPWRFSYLFAAAGIVTFLGIMVYRWRTSKSYLIQQQARLVLWGGLVSFLPIFTFLSAPLIKPDFQWNPVLFLPFLLVFPLSVAIAILRYRLWDVDVIINRTLVYGVLTVLLGITYLVSVVALQLVFLWATGSRSQLAVATSTLGIAALFNPLRLKVQLFIDRRFYRRKYDTAKALTTLATALKDEVDLTRLVRRLERIIWQVIQPSFVVVYLRKKNGYGLQSYDQDEAAYKLADEALQKATIDPQDLLVAYLQKASSIISLDEVDFVSPALSELMQSRIQLAVPISSQGELIGWISLGRRVGDQGYTQDDQALLIDLAVQVAPAMRVAQLVEKQEQEARERDRIEHELNLARTIQNALLPKEIPIIAGWSIATYYQPARVVGGDFYDFIDFKDGRLGIIIGDVTDKGIPAAMVMATTRSLLRAAAQPEHTPGEVLRRVNDLLVPDIPENMFVTCLYGILELSSGLLKFANAGQNLPLHRSISGVQELRARGMPLGLMEGMDYEEKEVSLPPQSCLILYSDGLVEAHNRKNEMFGMPRLQCAIADIKDVDTGLIDCMLDTLSDFTGRDWEQEDDMTVITLRRDALPVPIQVVTEKAVSPML